MTTTEPVEQLNAQQQAGEAAWKADDYARCERNASVRTVVQQLARLGPGWTAAERRYFVFEGMRLTFNRQLKIHGLAHAAIPALPFDEGGRL